MSRAITASAPRFAEYRPREVRFVEQWEDDGRRLKVYFARDLARPAPAESQWAALRAKCRSVVPAPGDQGSTSIGFVLIHVCRTIDYIFVVWWANENEMHRRLYSATSERPEQFTDQTTSDAFACVWEMRVIAFESEAWRSSVLANPAGPDLEAYFARTLNETM